MVDDNNGGSFSRESLRELYHDEVNPGFRVPRVHAAKWTLAISLITLVFLAATMLFKFNTFILMQEEVFAKRGHLEGAYQRRVNLFENLLKLTLNHAALEHEVFSHVADVRKDIIKKLKLPPKVQKALEKSMDTSAEPKLEDIGKALSSMKNTGLETSMGRLLGLVEQYPNIKSSETYAHLMTSLTQIEDRIAERRNIYQETVRMFNQEISRFPWYILAKATHFKRFDYFKAEEGAHSRPQIHSDIFEQLLPMNGKQGGVKPPVIKLPEAPAQNDTVPVAPVPVPQE